MNGMRPFAGETRFPMSVCNMLMDGLDSRLVLIFRQNYKDYVQTHDLQASYQRSKFPAILSAMQMSEDQVKLITAISRNSVNGQAFHSDALAFPSQAKTTLNRFLEVVAISWTAAPLMEDIIQMTCANHWGRMTPALVVRTLTFG